MDSADRHALRRVLDRWSLRRRLLLLVLFGAVLPLGVVGVWTTRTAVRSGEALLRAQLDSALTRARAELDERWRARRSDLLFLGENEAARRLLHDTSGVLEHERAPAFVEAAFARMSFIQYAAIRDRRGRTRFTVGVVPVFSGRSRDSTGVMGERGGGTPQLKRQ